jgi:hypothetical protein
VKIKLNAYSSSNIDGASLPAAFENIRMGKLQGLVLFAILAAVATVTVGSSSSLNRNGWLYLHQCTHQETPDIRGDNLVNNVGSFPPVSAADNANTKLQAVFSRGSFYPSIRRSYRYHHTRVVSSIALRP